MGSSRLNARWSFGRAIEFKFLAWSSIAQSVCQHAFSLLEIRFQKPWVRILYSAEEDNLSPFDSTLLPCYQRIRINTNKHVCMTVCALNKWLIWKNKIVQLHTPDTLHQTSWTDVWWIVAGNNTGFCLSHNIIYTKVNQYCAMFQRHLKYPTRRFGDSIFLVWRYHGDSIVTSRGWCQTQWFVRNDSQQHQFLGCGSVLG